MNKTSRVNLRIEKITIDKIREYANKNGSTLSEAVREVISLGLDVIRPTNHPC